MERFGGPAGSGAASWIAMSCGAISWNSGKNHQCTRTCSWGADPSWMEGRRLLFREYLLADIGTELFDVCEEAEARPVRRGLGLLGFIEQQRNRHAQSFLQAVRPCEVENAVELV